MEYYSKAIEIDPGNHVYYSNRSAALLASKKVAEALADGEKCIELKPDWPKSYSRKGAAQEASGDLEAAIATFDAGLKVDADNEYLLQAAKKARESKKARAKKAAKKARQKQNKQNAAKDRVKGVQDAMNDAEQQTSTLAPVPYPGEEDLESFAEAFQTASRNADGVGECIESLKELLKPTSAHVQPQLDAVFALLKKVQQSRASLIVEQKSDWAQKVKQVFDEVGDATLHTLMNKFISPACDDEAFLYDREAGFTRAAAVASSAGDQGDGGGAAKCAFGEEEGFAFVVKFKALLPHEDKQDHEFLFADKDSIDSQSKFFANTDALAVLVSKGIKKNGDEPINEACFIPATGDTARSESERLQGHRTKMVEGLEELSDEELAKQACHNVSDDTEMVHAIASMANPFLLEPFDTFISHVVDDESDFDDDEVAAFIKARDEEAATRKQLKAEKKFAKVPNALALEREQAFESISVLAAQLGRNLSAILTNEAALEKLEQDRIQAHGKLRQHMTLLEGVIQGASAAERSVAENVEGWQARVCCVNAEVFRSKQEALETFRALDDKEQHAFTVRGAARTGPAESVQDLQEQSLEKSKERVVKESEMNLAAVCNDAGEALRKTVVREASGWREVLAAMQKTAETSVRIITKLKVRLGACWAASCAFSPGIAPLRFAFSRKY